MAQWAKELVGTDTAEENWLPWLSCDRRTCAVVCAISSYNKEQNVNAKQNTSHNTQEVDATQMSTTRGLNKDHVCARTLWNITQPLTKGGKLYFLQHGLNPEDTVLIEMSRHYAANTASSAQRKDRGVVRQQLMGELGAGELGHRVGVRGWGINEYRVSVLQDGKVSELCFTTPQM